MLEHLATENPELFVASVHPGIFPTDMAAALDIDESSVPMDDRKSNLFCFLVKVWANDLMPRNWWRVEDLGLEWADSGTAKLPAHFLVWLTSPEGKFLRGRFLWAHWDINQLKEKAKEIEASPLMLTSNILGWPFEP